MFEISITIHLKYLFAYVLYVSRTTVKTLDKGGGRNDVITGFPPSRERIIEFVFSISVLE